MDAALSAALFLAIGCGGEGCAGCQTEPLPAGGLPGDQTVEGGAQLRLTPQGFDKVSEIVPGIANDLLADGVCIPEFNDPVHGCYEHACDNPSAVGCGADISINSLDTSIPNRTTLRVNGNFDAHLPKVDIDTPGPGTCTFDVQATGVDLQIDVAVAVASGSAELTLSVADVAVSISSNDLEIDGDNILCEGAAEVVEGAAQTFESAIEGFLDDPLNDALQNLLPDPLGIEGVVDLGSVLSSISPGTRAKLEIRLLPGGYVALENNGLSLGVITGINADVDPSTRSDALDSEPALCVPPHPAPDLSAPPASLAVNGRGNMVLPSAPAFSGGSDPATDLVAGVSETGLDLAGHHLVTSGALCLEVGTELVPQLNLGTLGILVGSLAELGSPAGNDPLRIVTRPQKPLDFSIGDGTDASPSITIHADDLEVDIYAWLFERYTRGFTASLDVDLGINVELMTDAEGNTLILPVLVGLDANNIGVTVLNAEFLAEDPADIEAVLPTLLGAILPLLGDALEPISLPEIAGFKVGDLAVSKVSSGDDDFLAIQGSLSPGAGVKALAAKFPSVQAHIAKLAKKEPAPARAETEAKLLRVVVPPKAAVLAALKGQGGALPEIVIDVDETDAAGRPLEHSYRINGSLWRQFSSASPLVIREPMLALQGKYNIEVRSRAVGDYRTLDLSPVVIPTIIDNVPPELAPNGVEVRGQSLVVTAEDLVSGSRDIAIAFGHPGAKAPETEWGDGAIAFAKAKDLAGGVGLLGVWAKDEAGNVAPLQIDISRLKAPTVKASGGCAAAPGGDGSGAGFLALLMVAAGLGLTSRRRRAAVARVLRRHGPLAILVLALGFGPACSCGGGVSDNPGDMIDGGPDTNGPMCEVADDCIDFCGDQIPTCFENACLCNDDILFGDVGPHTALAVAGGTAWVAAYNRTYGDLMVAQHSGAGRIPEEAWQFVDGVPEGPVVKEGSDTRGGIAAPGDDVGAYADIAVATDNTVYVSYFDATSGSLKLAYGTPAAWEIITVDPGAAADGEGNYEIAGTYTQIFLKDDGRPAIAYAAEVKTAEGVTSELRYAVAQSAAPTGDADFNTLVADSATITSPGGDENIPPISRGLGLFADLSTLSDGSPAIAYYDRTGGNLKLAVLDSVSQSFTTTVLAGAGIDAGWYPAVVAGEGDVLQLSYVSASDSDLLFVTSAGGNPAIIDDGYRIVGQTSDGLPKPELHQVGADSDIVMTAAGPIVFYQDATVHELRLAQKDSSGAWTHRAIAGNEDPFAGAYGFYIAAAVDGAEIAVATWVISQPTNESWVEILRLPAPTEPPAPGTE